MQKAGPKKRSISLVADETLEIGANADVSSDMKDCGIFGGRVALRCS
jgi:hypothetical protein